MKKTKYISSLLFAFLLITQTFFLKAEKNDTIQKNDTIYVLTKQYEGVIFGSNFPVNIIDNKDYRWNPSLEDIEQAELLLSHFLTKQGKKKNARINQTGDCPIIHLNIRKYFRQYIGRINKDGKKILEINFLWKDDIKMFPDWKTHYITILDGCSYYWSIKINLSKNKCYDFHVNGLG